MPDFFATIKDVAPWIAIVLSVAAITLSILTFWRDRAVLKATSHYYQAGQGFHASMELKIVNAGRRPIIIATWVGAETKQGRFGRRQIVQSLGSFFDSKEGITLGERQAYSLKLEADELLCSPGDGEVIIFDDIWLVDTLGHHHKVKNVRENIAKLWNWKSPTRKAG